MINLVIIDMGNTNTGYATSSCFDIKSVQQYIISAVSFFTLIYM